jgi:hypothetical protein
MIFPKLSEVFEVDLIAIFDVKPLTRSMLFFAAFFTFLSTAAWAELISLVFAHWSF